MARRLSSAWRIFVAIVAITAGLNVAVSGPASAYVQTVGPGGQTLADTLVDWASAGFTAAPVVFGLAADAYIIALFGTPVVTDWEQLGKQQYQRCLDFENSHGGFPTPWSTVDQSGCTPENMLGYMPDPSQVPNAAPWFRSFCFTLFTDNGSSWTAPVGQGLTPQSAWDTACPVPWRPFITGTGPAPTGSQPSTQSCPGGTVQSGNGVPYLYGVGCVPTVLAPPATIPAAGGNADPTAGAVPATPTTTNHPAGTLALSADSAGVNQFGQYHETGNNCGTTGGHGLDGSEIGNLNGSGETFSFNVPAAGATISLYGNGYTEAANWVLDGASTDYGPGGSGCFWLIGTAPGVGQGPHTVTFGTNPNHPYTYWNRILGLVVSWGSYTTVDYTCPAGFRLSGTMCLPTAAPSPQAAPTEPSPNPSGAPNTVPPPPPAAGTQTATPPPTKGPGTSTNGDFLDLGDRIVNALYDIASFIVNGIVRGLSIPLGWIRDVLNTILAELQRLLTWIGQLVQSVIDALFLLLGNLQTLLGQVWTGVDGLLRYIYNGLWTMLQWVGTAIVTAVNALGTLLAEIAGLLRAMLLSVGRVFVTNFADLGSLLRSWFVPDAGSLQAKAQAVKTQFDGTVLGTAVGAFPGMVHGLAAAADPNGKPSCGPSFGFDGIHGSTFADVPGFRVYLPSPPGCPGNGPGGSQTTQDTQAADLLGYRTLVRGLATAALLWMLISSLVRMAPWADKSNEIMPGGGGSMPLGSDLTWGQASDVMAVEARGYMNRVHR